MRLTERGEFVASVLYGIGVLLMVFGGVWLLAAIAYWWTGVAG